MSQPSYNFKAIRNLLIVAFSEQELRQLCYDTLEFRDVLKEFSDNMGRQQMAQGLIQYCERKVLLPKLLKVIEEEAPEQYARFADDLIVGAKKSDNESDEIKFLQEMISIKTRSLQHLQLQAAKFGISTPPHIAIQVEDLEKEIEALKQKLNVKP